jgi:hypothetical protein
MSSQFKVSLSSPPGRERELVDVALDGVPWIRIERDEEIQWLTFHSHPEGASWRFPSAFVADLLAAASRMLAGDEP